MSEDGNRFAESLERCEVCGKKVKTGVWLELRTSTGTYHEPGSLREEDSQGCFRVGTDCAKRLLAQGTGLRVVRTRETVFVPRGMVGAEKVDGQSVTHADLWGIGICDAVAWFYVANDQPDGARMWTREDMKDADPVEIAKALCPPHDPINKMDFSTALARARKMLRELTPDGYAARDLAAAFERWDAEHGAEEATTGRRFVMIPEREGLREGEPIVRVELLELTGVHSSDAGGYQNRWRVRHADGRIESRWIPRDIVTAATVEPMMEWRVPGEAVSGRWYFAAVGPRDGSGCRWYPTLYLEGRWFTERGDEAADPLRLYGPIPPDFSPETPVRFLTVEEVEDLRGELANG